MCVRFSTLDGLRISKGEMLDVELTNDMRIGGAQGSASCGVAQGMQQQERLPYFHLSDVAAVEDSALDVSALQLILGNFGISLGQGGIRRYSAGPC